MKSKLQTQILSENLFLFQTHKNPDWRDQLKPSKDEHGPEHGEGEEGEGGEPQETQAEATLEIEEWYVRGQL